MDSYGFSVVIPTYNSSKYIHNAFDSISEASQGREYEIIVVDDCSKDLNELREVIDRYEFARIVSKKEKTNAADSRNIGIEEACHDLVFLLDSDDLFFESPIERRMNLHSFTGAGVAFGGYITKFRDKAIRFKNPWKGGSIRDYIFNNGGDFRTSTISIFKPNYKGTTFDKSSVKHQDWIFGIKCNDSGESLAFDEKPSCIINIGSSSRMSANVNYTASQYLIENYLSEQSHVNGFSLKNWKNAVVSMDADSINYYISIYKPFEARGKLRKCLYWAFSRRFSMPAFAYFIAISRKVKWSVWV